MNLAVKDHATPTTLYLARHGQSEWNNQSRITGQSDIGLSDKGIVQSQALAQCLQGVALDAIYTSALKRTVATAQPTAAEHGLTMVSLPALNEIHMGVLQGRLRDERDPEAQTLWKAWQADLWNGSVPGGEGFGELAQRVLAAIDGILQRHAGQSVLVVGHRGTNRVVLGHLLGWPRERWGELGMRNKHCYRLRLGATPEVATFTLGGSKNGRCEEGLVL
jgi:broad specificity phosphatase PhoE